MKIRITSSVEALRDIEIPQAVAECIAGKIMRARPVGGGSNSVVLTDSHHNLDGWSMGKECFRLAPHSQFGFSVPADIFQLVVRSGFPTPHISSHQISV